MHGSLTTRWMSVVWSVPWMPLGHSMSGQINVDSWSTPEEREMLITTMVEKKPADLLEGAAEAGGWQQSCSLSWWIVRPGE